MQNGKFDLTKGRTEDNDISKTDANASKGKEKGKLTGVLVTKRHYAHNKQV